MKGPSADRIGVKPSRSSELPGRRGSTDKERCPRLEKVTDGLFEGEEAVLHVMGWVAGGAAMQEPGQGPRRWSLRAPAARARHDSRGADDRSDGIRIRRRLRRHRKPRPS